ncbi:MAG: cadherin-like domain-containing protein [Magnetococcales bacterium]|nr:cadherin-like domain-containing protein [Magnetococcales bacterium]
MIKHLLHAGLIVLLVLLGPMKPAGAADATSFNVNDFNPLQTGNSWTYNYTSSITGNSSGTASVTGTTYVNGYNTTVVTSGNGNKIYYTNDATGLYRIKEVSTNYTVTYSPAFKYASSSVTIGSSFPSSGTVTFTVTGMGSFALNYTSNVYIAGFETVTVPAGTFYAAQVQATIQLWGWSNGSYLNALQTETLWMVGGLGLIKTSTSSTMDVNYQSAFTESTTQELTASNLPLSNKLTTATTGSGSIASTPAGITCGSDCTESYSAGTFVTLTATPAVDALFNGWSGACSGTGSCSVLMSAAKSVTANFKLINAPPTASNGALSTNEEVAYSGTLTASDPDNNGLTYSMVTQPGKGTVSITNTTTGAFTYTPNSNANGGDSFTFKVHDGKLDSNTATMSVTINAINDPATISGTPATLALRKTQYRFTPTVSDVDGDNLTYSIANKPAWASFDTNTGQLSGTPTSDNSGSYANIVISVSDGVKTVSLPAFTLEVPAFTLDVDGNGRSDPLTDGLLVLRYLYGMRDESLIQGTVDAAGSRTTASTIQSHLNGGLALLDVDGSGGTPDYTTDGLLILRYLFGFRGNALTDGAVSTTATRKSAEEIRAYIETFIEP